MNEKNLEKSPSIKVDQRNSRCYNSTTSAQKKIAITKFVMLMCNSNFLFLFLNTFLVIGVPHKRSNYLVIVQNRCVVEVQHSQKVANPCFVGFASISSIILISFLAGGMAKNGWELFLQ